MIFAMPKPLGLSLKDYIKAVEICISEKYGGLEHYPNRGSAYTFAIFEKKGDKEPCVIWSIHHGHNKKKELWSKDDFKKILLKTAVSEERFLEVLKDITGRDY